MKKNTYLCKEFDEEFIIEASSIEQAIEDAAIYGGVVLKQLTEEEIKELDIQHIEDLK